MYNKTPEKKVPFTENNLQHSEIQYFVMSGVLYVSLIFYHDEIANNYAGYDLFQIFIKPANFVFTLLF